MRSLLLVLALVACANAGGIPRKMVEAIKTHKLMESCWGKPMMQEWWGEVEKAMKTCHEQEPKYTVENFWGDEENRVTRQAEEETHADAEIDDDHIEMFIEKYEMVKELKTEALSNLSCVMQSIKLWNEDNSVNIDYLTGEMLEDASLEDELKEMMKFGYNTCYKFSEALPVEDMKNPIKKMFGKQLMFQKCLVKTEEKLCAMNEVKEYMEHKYGAFSDEKIERMGLPNNKYEAALYAKMVMKKTMPDTKKFVLSTLMTGMPDM